MIWTTRPRFEGAGALGYFAQGAGSALVLIHGVGLRAEAWAAVLPMLARDHQVICVDMPGHGTSPLNGAATLDDFVARLTEFIDTLDGPVRLAGHSMGALISACVAAQRPNRIEAMVGLNTVYKRPVAATRAVRARATNLASAEGLDPTPTLDRWFGQNPQAVDAECARACRDWLTGGCRQGYATAYRIFAQEDGPAESDLRGLQCRALFLTGENDPNSTPAMSQALAATVAHGRACVIEGAAHMVPMTHAQQVAACMSDFFTQPHPDQKGS